LSISYCYSLRSTTDCTDAIIFIINIVLMDATTNGGMEESSHGGMILVGTLLTIVSTCWYLHSTRLAATTEAAAATSSRSFGSTTTTATSTGTTTTTTRRSFHTMTHTTMSSSPPAVYDLVLIGGGHAHVHVLKMLGMPPYRSLCQQYGIQITLIASSIHTPYSGMLPGYLSGHYTYNDIHLDLAQLCSFSGIRLIHGSAYRITYSQHQGGGGTVYVAPPKTTHSSLSDTDKDTCIDARPPIRYDCLSIDVGSQPGGGREPSMDEHVVPVKPIGPFAQFYETLMAQWEAMVTSLINNNHDILLQQQQTSSETAPPIDREPYVLAVVGGGAGGMELTLSLEYQLSQIVSKYPSLSSSSSQHLFQVVLITRGNDILPDYPERVRRIFHTILHDRHIRVVTNATVTHVEPVTTNNESSTTTPWHHKTKHLVLHDASQPPIIAHDILWCATAQAPTWLSQATPFACTTSSSESNTTNTAAGFLRVHDTYECIHHPGVFAAGDCAHMDAHPRPKAGVFAVRAGPYLLHNLVQYLLPFRGPAWHHVPQRHFLTILTTGNQYAVASKGNWLCVQGTWVWHWKKYIDTKWMNMYTQLPDMETMMQSHTNSQSLWDNLKALVSLLSVWQRQPEDPQAHFLRHKSAAVQAAWASSPMRCGGCGAKVGATTVARVLQAVYQRQVERAQRYGYPTPTPIDHDDAAVVPLRPVSHAGDNATNSAWVHTMDYFRSMISDPYIFGKIAAVHALSDCHAMGAPPQSALVLAVTPFAAEEAITENTLLQILAGVSDVLQDEQVHMIGGHTCEGVELACGLSVQGYIQDSSRLLRKRGGRVGDCMVLTKPLGTGALLAAHMRAQCTGAYLVEAVESMCHSNVVASRIAMESPGVHSCTDVTGFGLIGHLLEMLMANHHHRLQQQKQQAGEADSVIEELVEEIGAVLSIRDIAFLQGGLEASRQGILSTLSPQNSRNRRAVFNHKAAAKAFPVEYPLLFDPQTAGGLLFFVSPEDCGSFVAKLQEAHVNACVIGRLEAYLDSQLDASLNKSVGNVDSNNDDQGVCTIGSGETLTGQRIRIEL
jgi:selenide, water dikinase